MSKRKILFVCSLNTARSAACEYILNKYAGDRFEAKSAGLLASGTGMSPTLISALNKYEKIPKDELLSFKSTRFSEKLGNWADMIICVTREHASIILDEYPEYSNKVNWFEYGIEDNTRNEDSAYLCILNIKRNLNELFDIEKDSVKIVSLNQKNVYYVQLLENEIFGKEAFPMNEAIGDFRLGIVAKVNNTVAGYIATSYASDQMDVLTFGVKKEFRRRGIGEKIMRKLFELAAEKGVKSVFLEVRYGNESARLLYEKTGFVKCGIRSGYYSDPKEDAVLYECVIGK